MKILLLLLSSWANSAPLIGSQSLQPSIVISSSLAVGGAVYISTSNLGIGTTVPGVLLESRLSTTGGSPATSGTAQPNASIRGRSSTGAAALDVGHDGATTGASWIQSYDATDLSTNRQLWVNPNGGSISMGVKVGSGTQIFRCSGGTLALILLYGNSGAEATACTAGGGSLVGTGVFLP